MNQPVIDLQEALREYFGFSQVKGDQEEIIETVMEGRDCLVIMPTGGGKSLCYQLPALMMEGTAIIISPLIALMKNQVDAIRGCGDGDVIADCLNSEFGGKEIGQVQADIAGGVIKTLSVAADTLTVDAMVEVVSHFKTAVLAVVGVAGNPDDRRTYSAEYTHIGAM